MDGFKAKDISMRAQKKIFSKMANKSIAKVFIDETSANILDNVYKLVKHHVSMYTHSLPYWKLASFQVVNFTHDYEWTHSIASSSKPLLLPEEVMEEPLWKIARFASETGLLN